MISAEQAKKIASKIYIKNNLEKISSKIEKACAKGEFDIEIEGFLDKELQEILKEEGYDVRVFIGDYDSQYTSISWD